MITVEELKSMLRIDHSFDDVWLAQYLAAATAYINGAIEVQDPIDPRFNLAVALLAGHYYESRTAATETNLNDIPFGVTSLINQLRGLPNAKAN